LEENAMTLFDPLNYCVVRIQTMFNDTMVSNATGFYYGGTVNGRPNLWLVTNWHVLSGRNASKPKIVLHSQKALPNRLKLELLSNKNIDGNELPGQLFLHEKFLDIYDVQNQALWFQHQTKSLVDVAVINLGDNFADSLVRGLGECAAQSDMAIEIGNEVFILGYPLGFSHFINTPIWKRGSIASEPHMETPESKDKIMIDATTRTGMSGSPDIMRSKTHYLSESGEIKECPNATRFIGVYASRPAPENVGKDSGAGDEDKRHELGYVFKSGLVHEIITSGIRGHNFDATAFSE
jgi:hypothetical protein